MLLSNYQKQAWKTAQFALQPRKNLKVSALGLSYEAGSVLNVAQTRLIAGINFANYKQEISEELGDCLWYVSCIAKIFDIPLSEIAQENIIYSQDVNKKQAGKKFRSKQGNPDKIENYYSWVKRTDIKRDVLVSVLGLVGEAGSVTTIAKKIFRKRSSLKSFRKEAVKELGDCLWYITSIALNSGLTLNQVINTNLSVINERWLDFGKPVTEKSNDPDEQFQKNFIVRFVEKTLPKNKTQTLMQINGNNFGDRLTDNSNQEDGYRYHDVFHLSFAAVLGWSPVLRGLLKCKRKSIPKVDEVQDGARAAIAEEAMSLLIYNYARKFNYFKGVSYIDASLLKAIQSMTHGLEVGVCTSKLWEMAILKGYAVFRKLRRYNGGYVEVDLVKRDIKYIGKRMKS